MLVEMYHLCGVADVAVGQLRHMHQSVLMHTDIYKSAEVIYVRAARETGGLTGPRPDMS